jgi:hypothetical protein
MTESNRSAAAAPAAARSITSATTVFEPSASDPRIVAALAARARLNEAFEKLDAAAVDALCTVDFVVNAPINKVANKTNVMARFRAQ